MQFDSKISFVLIVFFPVADILVPSFTDASYLSGDYFLVSASLTTIVMEMRAESNDGVIFWNSDGTDFIGLGLVGGYVHFTYDLGSGMFLLVFMFS